MLSLPHVFTVLPLGVIGIAAPHHKPHTHTEGKYIEAHVCAAVRNERVPGSFQRQTWTIELVALYLLVSDTTGVWVVLEWTAEQDPTIPG